LTTLQSKRHESPILSQSISCIFRQPFQAKAANPPFRLKAFLAFFDNPSKQKARIPHFVSKHFLHFSTTLPSKRRESPILSQGISCIFRQPFQAKAANPPFRLKAFLAFFDNPSKQKARIPHFVSKHFLHFSTTLPSKSRESHTSSQSISCIIRQPFQAKAANPPLCLKAFLAFFDNPSKQKPRIPHFVSKHFLHFSTTLPSKSRESPISSQSISCIFRRRGIRKGRDRERGIWGRGREGDG
jgi:hypothetical protein